jgi:hypothetical protein
VRRTFTGRATPIEDTKAKKIVAAVDALHISAGPPHCGFPRLRGECRQWASSRGDRMKRSEGWIALPSRAVNVLENVQMTITDGPHSRHFSAARRLSRLMRLSGSQRTVCSPRFARCLLSSPRRSSATPKRPRKSRGFASSHLNQGISRVLVLTYLADPRRPDRWV